MSDLRKSPLVALGLVGLLWTTVAPGRAAETVGSRDGVGEGAAANAEASLHALDRAYVEAWMERGSAQQEAALLPLFAEDAVILPGGGTEPKEGLGEIRAFWFPEGAPPTNVRSFEHVVHGVDVQDGLGVIHGRSRLDFEYGGQEAVQEGNFLIVARRTGAGEWKITRMIWNNRTLP